MEELKEIPDLKAAMRAMLPTDEEIAEAGRRATERREHGAASGGFNPLNLGHWMELCHVASVPAIPAHEVARITIEDALSFDDNPTPPAVMSFFQSITAQMEYLGPNWMIRWACCSCMEIKYQLSQGHPEWHPDFARLYIDDPRAFDIIYEYPDTTIAAYARPWADLQKLDGYPVEYRVFVTNGKIEGVSNYYPQRALPEAPETYRQVAEVQRLTAALIAAQTRPLNCPKLNGAPHLEPNGNHWTADFAVTASGLVVFLEGGPPHTTVWGAHPCCFAPGEVEGVALSTRWECRS